MLPRLPTLLDPSASRAAVYQAVGLLRDYYRDDVFDRIADVEERAGPEVVDPGLIAAGCDVVTVQRALGHASATTTLNTYSHLWPTAEDRTRRAAGELMSQVLATGRRQTSATSN